jgi:hypothetical protein
LEPAAFISNILSPPILFFVLGLLATWLRSDLTIPPAAAKAISIYLLVAIGFHGGVELSRGEFDSAMLLTLGAAVAASALLPLLAFLILRFRLERADAAAIAACYGSVSAVTFITAISFLDRSQISYSGYMIAAMALMESPAIITAIVLARLGQKDDVTQTTSARPWSIILHEALANGAILLLFGSLLIGFFTGEQGWITMKPLIKDPFQAILCFFLLDMGLVAARRIADLRRSGLFLMGFAILIPPLQALIGIITASLIGLSEGNALLLAVLFGSASYIAVPAALRLVIPKANASLYIPMSLGLTFPLNITIGIPVYFAIIQWWWN